MLCSLTLCSPACAVIYVLDEMKGENEELKVKLV